MMSLSGFGQAGERLSGKRDVEGEVKLPAWQALAMVITALIAFAAIMAMGAAMGRSVVFILSVLAAFMLTDRATEWLGRFARHPRMIALIYGAEAWFPWVWLVVGLFVLRVLMPFDWAFNSDTGEHFLVLLRYADQTVYSYDATGLLIESTQTLPLNKIVNIGIAFRVGAVGLSVAVLLATGVAWRHFKNELDAFYPMKAIDPSMAGSDPREWKRRRKIEERPSSVTVHVETVMRGKASDVGAAGVFPGDQIVYSDIAATREQWELVTSVALRRVSPTEARMIEEHDFSANEWRTMRDGMVASGLMEAQGNGEHGANAGYDFTDAGREFFKRRKWDRSK